MKKLLVNAVCGFVPKKEWRHKIRAALLRDKIAELETKIDKIAEFETKIDKIAELGTKIDKIAELETKIDKIAELGTKIDIVGHNIEAKIDIVKNHIDYRNSFKELIWVLSLHGEDFKSYFMTHNMPEVLARLKNGLDDRSKQVVDQKLTHFLHFPIAGPYHGHFRADTREILYTDEDREERNKFFQNHEYLLRRYKGVFIPPKFSQEWIPSESFYYHHGLKLIEPTVLKYLDGKTLLDIGALYGDSAIALSEYGFSKIHMFELVKSSEDIVNANILANGLDPEKYIFHNIGLSEENSEITINEDADFCGISKLSDDKIDIGYKVPITTVDEYFSDTHESIGMIKMDVEGAEYPVIRGAIETIKKHRPILTIAIYHSPDQFFELKPYLENRIQDGYKYMIRNLNFHSYCELETTLICIPREALSDSNTWMERTAC